jgi:hypothetical protein
MAIMCDVGIVAVLKADLRTLPPCRLKVAPDSFIPYVVLGPVSLSHSGMLMYVRACHLDALI